MSKLTPTELKRLHRGWRRGTERRVALILDNVQTPYNVGSIMRLAAAWRVAPVWLTGSTVLPNHPGARKTALGTDRLVDWRRIDETLDAVSEAHTDGFTVVALELSSDALPLHQVELDGDVCLVLGHEERGVADRTLAACDAAGYLPLLGRVGSLNVAIAAAAAVYEVRRREWSS